MNAAHNGHPSVVCMYVPTASGGHARYAHELMRALACAGSRRRFELVTAVDLEPEFDDPSYPIHRVLPRLRDRSDFSNTLSWAASRSAYYLRRERSFLRWLSARPDISIVHLQEWKAWLFPQVVRRIRAMGKHVCATVHNITPHHYPRGVPHALVDALIRSGCRRCSGLFVHTSGLAAELRDFLGPGHPPIHVTPHGVWHTPTVTPPPLRQRLKERRLLFFGVLREDKGLDRLLAAMEHLKGYQLTVAGAPEEPAYYRERCLPLIRSLQSRRVPIDLRARFLTEPEVDELFVTHSAVVLPYTRAFRAQSGVIYDAIAYGMPVVASTVGGLGDLMVEHPIGTACSDLSPEGIAQAVRSLFDASDPESLSRALDRARAQNDWQHTACATLEGYERGTL